MAETMINRVARTLYRESPGIQVAPIPWSELAPMFQDEYRDKARAVIADMREPTDAMSTRGDAAAASLAISNDSSGVYTWQVMVDAALEEGRP